jgi:hypothetical protein
MAAKGDVKAVRVTATGSEEQDLEELFFLMQQQVQEQ